jgi:hypothetical protein
VSKYGLTKVEQRYLERTADLIEKQDHMACSVARDHTGCYCTMGALAQIVAGNHADWDAWDYPDEDLANPSARAYALLAKKIAPAFDAPPRPPLDAGPRSPARIYRWNDDRKTLRKTEDEEEFYVSALTPTEVADKLREIAAA